MRLENMVLGHIWPWTQCWWFWCNKLLAITSPGGTLAGYLKLTASLTKLKWNALTTVAASVLLICWLMTAPGCISKKLFSDNFIWEFHLHLHSTMCKWVVDWGLHSATSVNSCICSSCCWASRRICKAFQKYFVEILSTESEICCAPTSPA